MVLVLPVPAVVAAQVDEREQGWLCNSFCLGSVDHLLLVALVLPVPVVGAAQVDAEEARTDAQPLLGDGDLILLVALVLTVLAVSVQGDVEEARLAAEMKIKNLKKSIIFRCINLFLLFFQPEMNDILFFPWVQSCHSAKMKYRDQKKLQIRGHIRGILRGEYGELP